MRESGLVPPPQRDPPPLWVGVVMTVASAAAFVASFALGPFMGFIGAFYLLYLTLPPLVTLAGGIILIRRRLAHQAKKKAPDGSGS